MIGGVFPGGSAVGGLTAGAEAGAGAALEGTATLALVTASALTTAIRLAGTSTVTITTSSTLVGSDGPVWASGVWATGVWAPGVWDDGVASTALVGTASLSLTASSALTTAIRLVGTSTVRITTSSTLDVPVVTTVGAFTVDVFAQLTPGIWTNLQADVNIAAGLRIHYGISGNTPNDCIPSVGECTFALRNDTGNSGAMLGWYSPSHVSHRAGWAFGIPIAVVFSTATPGAMTSLTRSSLTVTVTTSSPHGLATGHWVVIRGATQPEYNGLWQVTQTGATTYTYTILDSGVTTPATGTITSVQGYVKFRGKVSDIQPDPGAYRSRRVYVTCYDVVKDLVDGDVREIAAAANLHEDTLIENVLDALPIEAQPIARDVQPGADEITLAFDNVGGGTKAIALIYDLTMSSYGLTFVQGDGTFSYRTRHQRAAVSSSYAFTNTMTGLVVPSSLDKVYNRVRVVIHPLTIDGAATTVLWSQTGTSPQIASGGVLEVWGDYRDPNDTSRKIGGIATVAPVQGTDFTANDNADGSGTSRDNDIDVAIDAFASTVKFTITNNHTGPVYVTSLQIRGKGVYDNGPRTFESYTPQAYGDRPITIDMPYQDDAHLGQSAADYIKTQYMSLSQQIEEIEFYAMVSADFLAQALQREPGDMVTITETVTGLDSVNVVIHSVDLEVQAGGVLLCRWGVAPAAPFASWQLGVPGASELGETTVLGF